MPEGSGTGPLGGGDAVPESCVVSRCSSHPGVGGGRAGRGHRAVRQASKECGAAQWGQHVTKSPNVL